MQPSPSSWQQLQLRQHSQPPSSAPATTSAEATSVTLDSNVMICAYHAILPPQAAMSMPPAPTPHHEPTRSEPTNSNESAPPTGSPTFKIVGDNVCAYAPDHTCYPSTGGWPKCCEKPDSSDCLSDVDYPCEESKSTRKPTRKPTCKPALNPTRKPTRKPTTEKYSPDRSLSVCTPTETEVNVIHGGEIFSFKWNETSYGRCDDEKENTYSYGAYYNITSYEECAKTCLNKMD